MLRVEFHCHTIYSKDSLTKPAELLAACRKKGIDRVVVTDHNAIQGALEAKSIDPARVIVGEEIMTHKGELLAVFVQEQIPRGLDPLDAINELRAQGAFISVSHPFDLRRSGAWQLPDLLEIAPLVDAIEVYNSRCLDETPNRQAQAFAEAHGLAGTVGSDAHILWELGRATLLLPDFQDAASLKQVLPRGQARVAISGSWVHFASVYARLRKTAFPK